MGSGLSVLDFLHLGSSLSLRSFGRLGSGLSVVDFLHLGSSLSLRSFGRIGSGLSVLDFLHLGSSLSLRSFARLGSAASVAGLSRFGSSLSVLDFVHLGSSLSLRSFSRFGSAVSVLDFVTEFLQSMQAEESVSKLTLDEARAAAVAEVLRNAEEVRARAQGVVSDRVRRECAAARELCVAAHAELERATARLILDWQSRHWGEVWAREWQAMRLSGGILSAGE